MGEEGLGELCLHVFVSRRRGSKGRTGTCLKGGKVEGLLADVVGVEGSDEFVDGAHDDGRRCGCVGKTSGGKVRRDKAARKKAFFKYLVDLAGRLGLRMRKDCAETAV